MSVATPGAATRPAVTDEQIRFYAANGYLQLPQFFPRPEMDALREAIDEAIRQNRARIKWMKNEGRESDLYEKVFNQMVNVWTDSAPARVTTLDKRLAETAARLSGSSSVRLYHDHVLVKPGGETSRATNWHQDLPYWPMDPAGALSAWIAVDDVTPENGCMQFIPGSHKFGKQKGIGLIDEKESIVAHMESLGHKINPPVTMDMKAGGVTFHSGNMFHSAFKNRTDRPRRAFAIIYIPDYVMFTGGEEAAGAGKEMPTGGPWDHPLHPVLWSNHAQK